MSLEEFHLLRPWWLLALLPLAFLLWRLAAAGAADQAWRRVMDGRFLRRLMPEAAGRVPRWPLALAAAGWLAGTLALAGPAWERLPQPAFRAQTPLVLALAMTPSMQAPDPAPSRLARARFELRDLLAARAEGRTGLVIYADEPFTVAPLTDDPKVIDAQVPVLKPDLMPGRGDRPDRAIAEAAALLRQAGAPSGGIVVLADSAGAVPDDAARAAAQARAAGYPVSVLAVLPAGAAVPAGLSAIAAEGGGALVRLTPDDRDIAALLAPYTAAGTVGRQAEAMAMQVDDWQDEGFWLLFLPLALAPLAFRRGVIAMLPPAAVAASLMLAPPGPAHAGAVDPPTALDDAWTGLWSRADQQGAEAMAAGDPARAAQLFADPAWQAAAQYRAGAFDAAAARLARLEGAAADYNRGNALARAGRIEEAIAAYDMALSEKPDHADARHNRDLLQTLLDRQQRSKQQQSGQDGQDQQRAGQDQSRRDGQDQQQAGQQQADQQQTGQQQAGQQRAGQQQAGQQQAGQQQAGQQQAGQQQSGQQQAGQQRSGEDREQQQAGQDGQDRRQAGRDQAESGASAQAQGAESEALGDRIDRAMQALLEPGMDEPAADAPTVRADLPGQRSEQDQAAEQWLARVKDDPGALLREKLRRKYLENRYDRAR